jgi:hypothetical protein
MATIQKLISELKPYLEDWIPEIERRQKEKCLAEREAAISGSRGHRHWWFGKIKTDQELIDELSHFHEYFWSFKYLGSECAVLKDILIACNTSSMDFITLTEKECEILYRVNKILNPDN